MYRVDVCPNAFGEGTCGAPGCQAWGNVTISFRDVATIACGDSHVLAAATALVRERIPRNVKRFRVQAFSVSYTRVETVFATSAQIDGPATLATTGDYSPRGA